MVPPPPGPPPPAPRRMLRLALWALLGAAFGATAVDAHQRAGLESGPPGWTTERPALPVQLDSLKGGLGGGGWPLDSHNALVGPAAADRLAVAATVPTGATLRLLLTDGSTDLALELDRAQGDAARLVATRDSRRQSLRCDGGRLALAPGDAHSATLSRVGTTVVAELDGTQQRCGLPRMGASRPRIEAGLRQARIASIDAGGVTTTAPQAGGAGPLAGALVGALVAGALGALLPGVALLAALPLGLAPLLSRADLAAWLEGMRIVADRPALWAPGLAAALAGIAALLLGAAAALRHPAAPPRALPAVGGAALGLFGVAAYGLGIGILTTVGGAVAGGLLPVLGARLWPGEGPSLGRAVAAAGAVGGALGLGVLALQPRYGMAGAVFAEVGALAVLVLWANLRAVRGFNLLSLAGALAMVALADNGLRWTALGDRLVGVSARSTAGSDPQEDTSPASTWSSFEALETTRQWSDYPDQDYPVAPAPRRPGALRIVALGGSSTGGAWQNDDLDEFWPAELERVVGPRVQVVNQGVGGWTSFHLRRYLETRIDDVDPDLVVLYIGHNDAMTPSALPYAQLFTAWQSRDDWRLGLSERLGSHPLYQLFRHALVSGLLADAQGVAVPPEDLADNLATVVGLVRARGGRVVLALEGISPSAAPLDRWAAVMQAEAEAPDVLYVDTAAALATAPGGRMFLDACHLSEAGHAVVARSVAGALDAAGWLP